MADELPGVKDEGQLGGAPEAPVAAAPVPSIDAEALVQAAVRRIAESITPVLVLEPSGKTEPTLAERSPPPLDHGAEPSEPHEPAATQPASAAAGVGEPDSAVDPAVEAGASDASAPEVEPEAAADASGPVAAADLDFVARAEDRILPEPALPQRIEPTFDAPPQTAPAASLLPELLVEDRAPPEGPRGLFSGPWTVRRVARLAGLAVAAYFGFVLILILIYRFINPPTTTLIAYQWLTGTKIEKEWVPIEDISSNLLRAVVVSEDWGFCDHYGVDLVAIEKALEQAGEGKVARGASTISMQVIKNLFLSQSKSYLRKAIEIPLTFVAEAVWPKSRMLEIYLNIAEWGPGVFGAEAAARYHFSKHASELSQREAALLAATLPNPILRDAGDPGTRTARKASVIQQRMRAAGPVADCAMTGRQRSSDVKPDSDSAVPAGWQTTVKKRASGS